VLQFEVEFAHELRGIVEQALKKERDINDEPMEVLILFLPPNIVTN